MVKPIRKVSTKNPPILSHEFIIQNHADIVSCIAMVFVVGLLVPSTTSTASIFITLQHNTTELTDGPLYTSGMKDLAAVFFYSLICVVVHAIIQEFLLDKISKRLHLSKSKLAVFNASGQLAIYYLGSIVWGYDIIFREKLIPSISMIWSDYPSPMSFMLKLYIIIQIAYSLHELPEIYFQRTKKEDYVKKAVEAIATLIIFSIPYFLNFNKLLLCLIVQHYTSELFIHIAQLTQTIDKDERFTKLAHVVSNGVMVVTRVASIILAFLTLWFGLAQGEQKDLDIAGGYFNVPSIRIALLAAILILQAGLIVSVTGKELQYAKDTTAVVTPQKVSKQQQKKEKSKKVKKSEESDLPEVDQNTNKNLTKKVK